MQTHWTPIRCSDFEEQLLWHCGVGLSENTSKYVSCVFCKQFSCTEENRFHPVYFANIISPVYFAWDLVMEKCWLNHRSLLMWELLRLCLAPLSSTLLQELDSFDIGNMKTSQELRMLSSVTINCQLTKIVINPGSQLSVCFGCPTMILYGFCKKFWE